MVLSLALGIDRPPVHRWLRSFKLKIRTTLAPGRAWSTDTVGTFWSEESVLLTVLFVGDEQNLLSAARQVIQRAGPGWDAQLCQTGAQALTLVAERKIDIVVAAATADGSGGAELLTQVRAHRPSTGRILLADEAAQESVLRSYRVAHRLLRQPCDVDELSGTVEALQACNEMVDRSLIQELVGRVEQLPALGRVYNELVGAIDRDTASNESLGAIVSQDVALTAELLRLINSAYFGLSRTVDSVGQAIGFLGIDVVRAIVAGHSLFGGSADGAVDLDGVAKRSQAVAALAHKIVRLDGGSASDAAQAYLAGMLHQVGVLVLNDLPDFSGDDLRAVLAADDITAERLEFGVDRFGVGGYLLGLWGFPTVIVDAISGLAAPPNMDGEPVGRGLRLAQEALRAGLTPFSGPSDADDDSDDGNEDSLETTLHRMADDLRRTGAVGLLAARRS